MIASDMQFDSSGGFSLPSYPMKTAEIECQRVVAMAANFGTKLLLSGFVWTIATSHLVTKGGLSGRPTECRYCRHPAPKGRCHGNHFCLSVYGVHIGATWRIRLNRSCTAAMRPYVNFRVGVICYNSCVHSSVLEILFLWAFLFYHCFIWSDAQILQCHCQRFVLVVSAVITYNAAMNRPAYQSSVSSSSFGNYSAHLANDGSRITTAGRYNIPRCSISQVETNPWWAVDLGRPTAVYRVDFTNRDYNGMR